MIEKQALNNLRNAVSDFIVTALFTTGNKKPKDSEWTVHEIIAHVASWQEYYAQVTRALLHNEKPELFKKSLEETNTEQVALYSKVATKTLLGKISRSTKELIRNVKKLEVESIPYKKGSRNYTPEEYINVITGHVKSHTKQVMTVSLFQ